MTKKLRLSKSISFGKKGELARQIMEYLIKNGDSMKVSAEVRQALVTHFSNKPEFQKIKISGILEQRRQLKKQIAERSDKLVRLSDELKELNYELRDLE